MKKRQSDPVPVKDKRNDVFETGEAGITHQTIRDLMDGDQDAFRTVYMTYHTPLEKFLSALLRSPSDAEEFSQQIMLEIWVNRDRLDPSKSIGGLIYTMAKRKAFSFIRHRYVEEKYIAEAVSDTSGSFSVSGEDIAIASETEILREYVLSRMPERRRRIYEMSRNEGLTYEEISRQLNVSQKTVEYHISQALKDFREVLSLFICLILLK